MSEKVYSYVVIGLITGEHWIEDIKIRVPYRTPIPITEEDFLNSKDLNRAVQQKLVKVVAQASIPSMPPPSANTAALEREVQQLRLSLTESEKARKTLESKIDTQGSQLQAILDAINKIPERTVVVAGGNGSSTKPVSEVVGGEAPMFIPSNIPVGTDARIRLTESEGEANLNEAAAKLRELRKRQSEG